jgi:hypothetical protein
MNATVTATRLVDGGFAWTHDFSNDFQGSPPSCGGAPPGLFPYLSSLADDGHGGLLVQLQSQGCGDAWNGDWTVKLDAQTGATLWVRPYLGAWLACQEAYGGGRIVSDEAGNAYVFEGFNAGSCPNRATGVQPRVVAYDSAGTTLWSQPWGFADWPTALGGGVIDQQSGDLLSTADGGLLRTVPLAASSWGVETVRSARGSFIVQGTISAPMLNVVRLDAQGAVTWSGSLDGGNFEVGDPVLTARDTLVVPFTSNYGSWIQSTALVEIIPDGGINRCPLPSLHLTDLYSQTLLLSGGRWFAVRWNPWFAVDAYQLPNVEPATAGWVCPGGSPAHGGRPIP